MVSVRLIHCFELVIIPRITRKWDIFSIASNKQIGIFSSNVFLN